MMHVAIVMDGNRRWARQRGLEVCEGHAAGERALHGIADAAPALGITTLSVFGFSTENWARGASEVSALMQLFARCASAQLLRSARAGIRVRICGDLTRFPASVRLALRRLEHATAANSRLTLVLALNYGGRGEILRAVRSMARSGTLHDHVTEEEFRKHLYLPDLPDPEIVIRTGGEQRLSNFLLFQLAYAEFVSSPVLWPDFTPGDLAAALANVQSRERRFGA